MGPYQRTPIIRYSGLGVRSVGPVADFLETWMICWYLMNLKHIMDLEFFCNPTISNEVVSQRWHLDLALRYNYRPLQN